MNSKHLCLKQRLGIIACVVLCAACSDPAQFRLNQVEVRKQEIAMGLDEGEQIADHQVTAVGSMLVAMFGTPDDPEFPQVVSEDFADLFPEESIVSLERLRRAAGPVYSDEAGTSYGLYREHCVHCHGISGDGLGPTSAFLNPYPRDYRMGFFKFKSTSGNAKPTREDLRRVINHGIPGTSMSSFQLLAEEEVEALVDYVIYLSIRGEVERLLLQSLSMDFDADEELFPQDEKKYMANLGFLLEDYVSIVVNDWADAERSVTPVPSPPESLDAAHPDYASMIARGRELYLSPTSGNCFSCHGQTGLGDGSQSNFDDWTKDWMNGLKVDPENQDQIDAAIALGVLPPREAKPRNLRLGVYRGGRRPIDLYWRIKNGIKGSPMPAAAAGLTDEDIWSLVAYIKNMPYEEIHRPGRVIQTSSQGTR